MSKNFHVNRTTGCVALCHATKISCPLGGKNGKENHFDTKKEALAASEKILSQEHGMVSSMNKKKDFTLPKWAEHELNSTKYLQDTFGEYAEFEHQGGADSTVSDILVRTKSGKEFFIEAKQCPAQSGQFVVSFDKTEKFIYGGGNSTEENESTDKIISHMNSKKEEFKSAGTAGSAIEFEGSDKVFSEWITTAYKNKNVEYFITNDNMVVPIEKFDETFDVKADYRIKRSGSSAVGKKRVSKIKSEVSNNLPGAFNVMSEGERVFVTVGTNIHNERFHVDGNEYMYSSRGDERYEVRRLSNTFGANVIFSLRLKDSAQGISEEDLSFELQK